MGRTFDCHGDRPRTQVARRAIHYVVGELVDAQALNTTGLRRLAPVLRYYGVDFVEKIPEVHLPGINRMNGIEQYGAKRESWVQDLREGVQQCYSASVDSLAVLAEWSQLKYLPWDLPWELRCSLWMLRMSTSYDSDVADVNIVANKIWLLRISPEQRRDVAHVNTRLYATG